METFGHDEASAAYGAVRGMITRNNENLLNWLDTLWAEIQRLRARLDSHADLLDCLVDLLEKAEQVDEEMTGPADRQYFSPALIAKARAAIAKAKGD